MSNPTIQGFMLPDYSLPHKLVPPGIIKFSTSSVSKQEVNIKDNHESKAREPAWLCLALQHSSRNTVNQCHTTCQQSIAGVPPLLCSQSSWYVSCNSHMHVLTLNTGSVTKEAPLSLYSPPYFYTL